MSSYLPIDRSQLPSPRSFYERELSPARLSRPNRKGWATTRCPFHKSRSGKSFAVNLETGGFHCFGCDAHGDMITFIQLLYHCHFKHALERLGIATDLTPEEKSKLKRARRERQVKLDEEAAVAQQARLERLCIRDHVHILARMVADAEACLDQNPESEDCWANLAATFAEFRESELEYLVVSGFSEDDL